MKQTITVISMLLISLVTLAQSQKATLENGKKVTLFSNRTWVYDVDVAIPENKYETIYEKKTDNTDVDKTITKADVDELERKFPNCIIKADYVEQRIWVSSNPIYFGSNSPLSFVIGEPSISSTESKKTKFYFLVRKDEKGLYRAGLRYKLAYQSSSWLFINEILIITALTNDETRKGVGNRYEIKVNHDDKDNEVNIYGSPSVSETIDIYDNPLIEKWLTDVAENSKFSRIRYKGSKGYEDAALRVKDLQPQAIAILDALKQIPKR
jgi:hypothetical protein